jgi:branched-chain amino acid transport system permease protein
MAGGLGRLDGLLERLVSRPGDTSVEQRLRRQRFYLNAGLAAVGLALLWALPYFGGLAPADLDEFALAMIYASAIMGLNLVFGLAGQVTLGPAAVFAVGAYASGLASVHWHWNVWVSLVAGTGAATVVGLLIGFPALRVGGFYLAIVTALAAQTIPTLAELFPSVTGGDNGLIGISPLSFGRSSLSGSVPYHVVVAALALCALGVGNVARSSWGRWFRALGSSEVATAALGVSVYRAKLVAFVMSAVFGGLAGGVYAHYQLIIDPTQFTFTLSVALFSALIIGGLGLLWGPVLGAFLYVLGPYFLLPRSGGVWVQVGYGAILIVLMAAVPTGLAGALGRLASAGTRRLGARAAARAPGGPPGRPSPSDGPGTDVAALGHLLGRAGRQGRHGPALEVRGVSKRFGGVQALDSVSLELAPGQVTALIGPNGSGKTTLLNVCSGHLAPDSGAVVLEGRDVSSAPAHRRAAMGLARTFQRAVAFPALSWTQSVMTGCAEARPTPWGAMLGVGAHRRHERLAAQRAEQLLGALGVGHLVGQPSHAATLAEARVAELARALALDPLVLMLDEPAAGLDLAETGVLGQVVAQAARAGVAVLLVEHDVAFVTQLADRVVVLDRGRLIFAGSPAEALRHPEVAAAYFGSHAGV